MLCYIHHYPWFHRGSGLTPRSLTLASYNMHNANQYNSIKLMLTTKSSNLINFIHAKVIFMLEHIHDMSYVYFSNYLCLKTLVINYIVLYYFTLSLLVIIKWL